MTWGGNDKPCGTATLMSIGCLGVEQNKKHAAILYPILEKELGIPGDRFVVFFYGGSSQVPTYNACYNNYHCF